MSHACQRLACVSIQDFDFHSRTTTVQWHCKQNCRYDVKDRRNRFDTRDDRANDYGVSTNAWW